ncbi:MAG TPA: HDOD domain-containing protein [Thiotrichales bacterium]|nr:HDOD domain-containing protein [Thiotrichales bacterium]
MMPNNSVVTTTDATPCALINASTQLTVLPAAVPELLAALSSDDLSFAELAEIITRFPSIAARLLFLANSAWAAPVAEITSLEAACVKLGLSVVKSISISIAIAAPFDPARCPAFRSDIFWSGALLVADGASWLASYSTAFRNENTGSVHTAALLHNLGLLWMADNISQPTNAAFAMVEANPDLPLAEALRDHCGADHGQIGGCLARAWGLPGLIEAAMAHHLDFSYAGENWEIAQLTGYAATLVHCIDEDAAALPDDLRLERLGIRAEQRDEVFKRLQDRHKRVADMVRVLFC